MVGLGRITILPVLPGKRLSYQKHEKRQEHWTIVKGRALVTLDGRETPLEPGGRVALAARRSAPSGG